MVKVEKDYVFEGPDGELRLIDMFEGRPQLYIHHFMWIDADDGAARAARMAADLTFTEKDRALLNAKGVTFAAVSRAPYASIARYRRRSTAGRSRGTRRATTTSTTTTTSRWTRPGADRVQLQVARRVARRRLRTDDDLRGDWPGASVFLRRGDEVFHTYSAFARGLDHSAPGYPFLDLTPYGRQETLGGLTCGLATRVAGGRADGRQ